MQLKNDSLIIKVLKISYLIVAAFVGFKVGHALFSISSLPLLNDSFYITNYLTDIFSFILCITFASGVVYLAYLSINHLELTTLPKNFLLRVNPH